MSHLLPLITAVERKFLLMQMCYFVMSHQIASALYLGTKRGGGWDRMWLQMEPKGFLKYRLEIDNWSSDAFSSKKPWKGKSSLWRQKWKAGLGVWEEGVLDGGVGRCQGKADELLIYANTLCIVRLVWSGFRMLDHIHLLLLLLCWLKMLLAVLPSGLLQGMPAAFSCVLISPSGLKAELIHCSQLELFW